jgi:SecD/SecF fusion protein
LLASIKDGFSLSYSAIIDANVTTILVAIVLGYFGLGPIKGFAVVLGIGVLLSLLTAVLLGRLIIDWWTVKKGNNLTFWTPPFKNAFANLNIDWLGKRKIAYVVSGLIIAGGAISLLTQGLNYGVDFKGGYQYEVEFTEGTSVTAESLRSTLTGVFGDDEPIVKEVSSANTYSITTDYLIDQSDSQEKVNEAFVTGLQELTGKTIEIDKFMLGNLDDGPNVRSSAKIGPTIAKDIKRSSLLAAIIALILIFAYIFARFSKWQYSMGAVAALAHDSIIVISVFSIFKEILPFSLEVDQAFIAAILTVIGYSINDTVVVFDRIREYLGIYTSKTTDEVLNLAINSTFSRTVITSITTLFVVLCLFIFGSGSIKGFAFAILIGVLVGTYSSIFVATPLLRDFTKDLRPKVKQNEKKGFSKALEG